MKKFLSLALALLMMLPLALGTSAGSILTSNPKKDTTVTVDEFKNLLEYWEWLNADEDDYDDLLDYLYGSSNIRNWRDKCEKCGKSAKYYVSNGDVFCSCANCGKTYEIEIDLRDDCDCCRNCEEDSDCDCGCWDCDYCEIDPGFTINPEVELNGRFNHTSKYCELDDIIFYTVGNKVCWYCDRCHASGYIKASEWDDDWNDYFWDYKISVYCSRGGDYDLEGGYRADYGDTRTITFTPDYGYVLTDVTVNGDSYGYCPSLTLTITSDTVIRATFVKASTLKKCTFTSSVTGEGTITAKKNGSTVDADKFTAKYGDKVTYKFTPAGDNYVIADVKIDGVSKGAIKSYTFNSAITKDHNIKVTFKWNSPYNDDISDNYLDAVEYVTEAGIMGYYNKHVNKNSFGGTKEISVKNLAAALAEMADVNEKLDTVEERIEWAEKNGIIDGDADLTVICDVQSACDIVNAFLTVLEEESDVDFDDFDDDDTAKENAISIGLVTEKTYNGNRNLTRYDLASICYLLVNLDVD